MKTLTKIGIGLLILSFLLFYSSSLQFQKGIQNSTLQSITILPQTSFYVPITISSSSAIAMIYYSNSSNITFYMLDSKAFSSVSSYLNSTSLLNKTTPYNGNGVYEIIYKNSTGVFPYQSSRPLASPSYYAQNFPILKNDTYYEIFQNSGSKSALVYYSNTQKIQASLNNSIVASSVYGFFAAMVFFIGIGVIAYSVFFKKEMGDGKVQKVPESVDSMFDKYSINEATARHKRKHAGTKRK